MKLKDVRVTNFRNFIDSGSVRIEDDITCIVGKNESGKTAFLQALYRLNPARSHVNFSIQEQYPAWLEKRDRMRGVNLDEQTPIKAVFALEDAELATIEARFGKGVLKSREIGVKRQYSGKRIFTFEIDERTVVQRILAEGDVPSVVAQEQRGARTLKELDIGLRSAEKSAVAPEQRAVLQRLRAHIEEIGGPEGDIRHSLMSMLDAMMPEFFFYGEYSTLPGTVRIRDLLRSSEKELSDDDITARSLLRLAAADDEYLLNPDYEKRRRELENVANAISEEVLRYWTQNPDLRVMIDISQKTLSDAKGQRSVLDELKIRMYDARHLLSLPFDERSRGFRWFFSFLIAFSEYEYSQKPIVILLDEPALGLHARAQFDFLRFIEERLAEKCQVIYSTHSPFMIQPKMLGRVRIVEDREREFGARVTEDVLSTDPDTAFPLQSAIGYNLARHLFPSTCNLVVERVAEYVFLTHVSSHFRETGRTSLHESWEIIPMGGAEMLSVFVTLLDPSLNVTILIGNDEKNSTERNSIMERFHCVRRVISYSDYLQREEAGIEDLFAVPEYLILYNAAFNAEISPIDIRGNASIYSRICAVNNTTQYDRNRPATTMLRLGNDFLQRLSGPTLERFERLFERINSTLE